MTCDCTRIISISGKCSDLCFVSYGRHEHDGYVPYGLGIGGGDEVEFDFCADCGKIQDFNPVSDKDIREALSEDEDDCEEDEEDDNLPIPECWDD